MKDHFLCTAVPDLRGDESTHFLIKKESVFARDWGRRRGDGYGRSRQELRLSERGAARARRGTRRNREGENTEERSSRHEAFTGN
jgi:hypothetical protein